MQMQTSPRPAPLADITAADVASLRAMRGPALVSIFAATRPSGTFGVDDRLRVDALVTEAERRVAHECAAIGLTGRSLDALRGAVAATVGARTGAGLALFERAGDVVVRRLPITVDDRVVVDPTFATRDIARAVALNPPHRALVLARDRARVMTLSCGHLDEHAVLVGERAAADRRGHHFDSGLSHRRADAPDEFVKRVVERLDGDRRTRGLPLLLVADVSVAARFRRWWRRPIAGVLHGSHTRTSPSELAGLLAPLVDATGLAERRKDLETLDRAIAERRVATDLVDVWSLASRQRLHVLYVDESCRIPARLVAGVPIPCRDATAPGVVDDIVDDIAELVLAGGGRVSWLPAGSLRIAPLVGVRRGGG